MYGIILPVPTILGGAGFYSQSKMSNGSSCRLLPLNPSLKDLVKTVVLPPLFPGGGSCKEGDCQQERLVLSKEDDTCTVGNGANVSCILVTPYMCHASYSYFLCVRHHYPTFYVSCIFVILFICHGSYSHLSYVIHHSHIF